MAHFLNKIKGFQETALGKILTVFVYLLMLALVLVFYTGNGEFIYEAF